MLLPSRAARAAVLLVTLSSAASVLGAGPAAAQSTPADIEGRAQFEAGRVAFVDERYDDALAYFRRAYEISGRAELRYNIAASLDRLDRDREALTEYEAYLAAVPDSPNREEVEFRLSLLRARLAREDEAAEEARVAAEARAARAGTTTERPASTERATTTGTSRTFHAGDPVDDTPPPSGGGDIASEPWFWVVMGIVAAGAGAGITIAVIASQDPGESSYIPGEGGTEGVIMTLTTALP